MELGGEKEGMQPGITLVAALYAVLWAQKFVLLLIFLASQIEET
jgi:hypothetical protein